MNLLDIISALTEAGIENSIYEAVLIASHFTGKAEALLLSDRNVTLECADEAALRRAVLRRASREPLQYILGEWDFMGLTFRVSEDCLIPRADTELLCEYAIAKLPHGGSMLDLCTGSGCIAVSVARYRKDVSVSAFEKYENTIRIAMENDKLITGGKIRFVTADVTDSKAAEESFGGESFDFIASNPPYVTKEEMLTLEPELSREPRHALTDEGDGLYFIRAIVDIYPKYLKCGGILAIEHGYAQGEAVRDIMERAGYKAETLRDLSGKERVTLLVK